MAWELDVIGILDELGVDYRESGTNVASNDVNIDCPWCGDSRKHLAVHKERGYLNCWVCGLEGVSPRPDILSLIEEVGGCSRAEAYTLIKEYREDSPKKRGGLTEVAEEGVKKEVEGVSLPYGTVDLAASNFQASRARIYLAARGFNPAAVARRYGVKVCVSGFYAGRLIIPIYFKGELVSWIGRDYTGCSKLRYQNCPIRKAKARNKDILYNYDQIRPGGQLWIVEGVTDVWARDNGETVATFTNKLHRSQLNLIIRDLKPRKVVLAFDGEYDSLHHAKKSASLLYPCVEEVKVLDLKGLDVADSGRGRVLEIERETENFY